MVTPVEIINGTMNVKIDQMPDTIFAIIAALASLAIAGITAYSLHKSNQSTQQSNKRLELELKSRIRPILRLSFVKYAPRHFMKEDGLHKVVQGEIGNTGNTPVRNIKFYFSYGNKKPENRADLLQNSDEWRKRGLNTDFGTIIPDIYKPFMIGEFVYDETESNPLWVVVWLEYEFLDTYKENCVFVFRVNGETVDEDQITFYSNSDIEEEKHRKKSDGMSLN